MKQLTAKDISSKKVTFQYAFMQGGYWASFCATYGYATVFLRSRGFSTSQIGIAIALANIMAVFLQPTIATIADTSKKISLHTLTIIMIILTLILFGTLLFTPNFFIATGALFVLTNAVSQTFQPLINAVSFYYINRGVDINFGLPRSMGSLSYAIVSTIIGEMVEVYGSNVILIAGVIIFTIMAIVLYNMPRIIEEDKLEKEAETEDKKEEKKESILSFFSRYKLFSIGLLGSTCIFIFHFSTNNYMLQIAESVGGGTATMGIALSVAAAFEVPSMMFSKQIMQKIKYNYLFIISGVFFCVKALVYIVAWNIPMLYFSQALQMVSYAFFIPSSVYLVNNTMNENDKVKGQAIMTGTTTLGGVIGSLMGGVVLERLGVKPLEWIGLCFAIAGAVLFFVSASGLFEKKKEA